MQQVAGENETFHQKFMYGQKGVGNVPSNRKIVDWFAK